MDIERGEFVTFLGPSGSGKTTTLTMIAGFEDVTSGQILLDGRDLSNLRPWKRNIGMVFQNYALFPHLTVADNVAFPLRMRGWPKPERRQRVGEMLDLVGLHMFAERYPRELSGGQQQRVALARGLVFSPDVVLLDEPLGALDKNLREQMQIEIKRIHREVGITTIYVTHDQTEAMTMSDRIAVFSNGRVEQIAAPLDIYHTPATRHVAGFVGETNLMLGRVTEKEGCLQVAELGLIKVPPHRNRHEAVTEYDVIVRPEHMKVVRGSEACDLNTFEMTVETVINYGDRLTLVGSKGGLPIRVRLNSLDNLPLEGEVLVFGWCPKDTHLIPRQPAGDRSQDRSPLRTVAGALY
ncbi:MAG: ABC transporter ATP-binding protein [Acidisphaera sp.]|nr:ABC transporter ATP-binding protein [Acidisphaera sp.]